jgi:DNA polymerase III sliding clamp (beta) subunit (PCNA family)
MDIEIRKDVLLGALERCSHPSGKDDGKPYAGRVLISINDDRTANFYAVDTYLSVDTAVPLESVQERGRQAVDTRRLQVMVSNLPGEIIHVKVANGKLHVTGDMKRRYTAVVVDPSMFPKIVEPEKDAASISLPGPKLAYLLQRVEHGTDSTRPHGDGIKLRAYAQEGLAVPTLEANTLNSYKLCIVKHQQPLEGSLPFEVFLPTRFLKPLLALADKGDEITLYVGQSMVFAETPDTLLGAMLPRDVLPDLGAMVAQVEPIEEVCEVPTISLREALKAIDAVRAEKTSCVRFRFSGGSLDLDLWGETTNATDTVPVKPKRSEPFESFANPKYVLEHLKGADANCVLMSSKAPVAFQTDDGYLGFLSPIINPPTAEDRESQRQQEVEEKAAKKKAAKKTSKKDDSPGPGRGGKKKAAKKAAKKTSKKTASKKSEPPPSTPVPEGLGEEDEDDLGSADPSQYA